MVYRIEYSSAAERELYQAYEYVLEESKSKRIASNWLKGILKAIDSLISHPDRCSHPPENQIFECEVRQLIYGRRRGRYRILFTVEKESVKILHIRHGARDILR